MKHILIFLILITTANAGDIYAAPDLSDYYKSLMQPDYPQASCCGAGDAYYADKSEECTDLTNECAFLAIITDTRPDQLKLADGTIIIRQHLSVGTKIVVPFYKLRHKSIPNPTDHNIIFVRYNNVYCYEPSTKM